MESNLTELNAILKSISDSLKQITSKMEKGIVVVMAANSPSLPIRLDEDSPSFAVDVNPNAEPIDVRIRGTVSVDS